MKNQKADNGFSEYGLSPEIINALTILGYMEPTEIQREVIPLALGGRHLAVRSKTGTGKTAAFAIPIIEKVRWEENHPQVLVLEPTRELSVQVSEEIFCIGRNKRLKVPAVFGGFPIDKQIQTLRQKSHIVVGTPGRVLDHIRRETMKTEQISCLVIDEADLMLDMGFQEEVDQIIKALPSEVQMLLFSATLDEKVSALVKEYMPDAVSIMQEVDTNLGDNIAQEAYEVETEDKYQVFLRVLMKEAANSCMIFCGTREMVNVLCRKLGRDGITCGMIHGEIDQQDRIRTIERFRLGAFGYLIATDVAARGVDFEHITHVINYDFPTGRETYVHRAGRTGRNGKSGKCISFITPEEQRMRKLTEEYMGIKIPVVSCPDKDEIEEKAFWEKQNRKKTVRTKKGAAFTKNIMRLSIGGGRKSKIRTVDIVGSICSIEGVQAEDIGVVDVRDSLCYVEILNGKGQKVLDALQEKTIKGKIRKVRITKNL